MIAVFVAMAVYCQFEAKELNIQPFAVTVCEESDRVVVTCCRPLLKVIPWSSFGGSQENQLIIFNAENFQHVETINLTGCYEIPRCAISIGCNFAVCHGWNVAGKVDFYSF